MKQELTARSFNETFGCWTPLSVALGACAGNSPVIRLLAPLQVSVGDRVEIYRGVFWFTDEPVDELLTRGAEVIKVFPDGDVEVRLSREAFKVAQGQLELDEQAGQTTFLRIVPAGEK